MGLNTTGPQPSASAADPRRPVRLALELLKGSAGRGPRIR